MRLIYPSDTFDPKSVDEIYADEFSAARSLGFPVSLFNFEDFQSGEFRPRPAIGNSEAVLFRCWMMPPPDYARLHSSVVAAGGLPVTGPASYQLCHHLPEWYPLLRNETAETRFYSETDDIESDLASAGWSGCFLKDYVKSLSTHGGSAICDLSAIRDVIERMKKYRGAVEGGLCARRLEDYDESTEKRYFVWRGTAFSGDGGDIPTIVRLAAGRVSSPFFTVDVARRADGVLRIVELGDGQVSDRKHWNSHDLLSLFL